MCVCVCMYVWCVYVCVCVACVYVVCVCVCGVCPALQDANNISLSLQAMYFPWVLFFFFFILGDEYVMSAPRVALAF